MPYKRTQIVGKDHIDIAQMAPVSSHYAESQSQGHFSKLMHDIYSIFTGEAKNSDVTTKNENMITQHNLEIDIKENEKQSLNDLEICANAARETEAYGQYEWINTSDE